MIRVGSEQRGLMFLADINFHSKIFSLLLVKPESRPKAGCDTF